MDNIYKPAWLDSSSTLESFCGHGVPAMKVSGTSKSFRSSVAFPRWENASGDARTRQDGLPVERRQKHAKTKIPL